MRVRVQSNDEDYAAYNIANQFLTEHGKKSVGRSIAFLSAMVGISIFVVALYVLNMILSNRWVTLDIIPILVVLIYFSYVLIFFKSNVKKRIRRRVVKLRGEGKLPYENEATLDFLDDMIMEYTPSSTTRREWKDIQSIVEDEEHFYLILGPMHGIIIPKRCIGAEAAGLIPFIQQKTGLGITK